MRRKANEFCCNESLNGSFAEWDSLMHECIEIESARDAKLFFDDVEKLAGRLGFKCVSGKAFSAREAMKEWNYIADKVQREIDSLIDKYGDGIDDLPLIGLKYFTHDDTLAIGIYDRGNFDAMVGWEFCNTPSCKNEAMFSGDSALKDILAHLQNNGSTRIHVYNNGKGGDGKLFVKVAYDGNNVYFTTDDGEKVLAKYVPSKVLLDAIRSIKDEIENESHRRESHKEKRMFEARMLKPRKTRPSGYRTMIIRNYNTYDVIGYVDLSNYGSVQVESDYKGDKRVLVIRDYNTNDVVAYVDIDGLPSIQWEFN